MRYYVARKGKKEITKELIYKLDNEKKSFSFMTAGVFSRRPSL